MGSNIQNHLYFTEREKLSEAEKLEKKKKLELLSGCIKPHMGSSLEEFMHRQLQSQEAGKILTFHFDHIFPS